jgi:glycosyltransferase involved in cell wall biosynthesis
MKILQIMAGADVGGAETFFVDAIKAIDEIGYEQNVITRANNKLKIQEIKNLNIPLQTASFNKHIKWLTAQKIKKNIATFQPDIVHHFLGRAGSYAVNGDHTNIGWYGGYYKPDRFSNCDYHVAVTQDVADHIVRQGIDAKNVFVLHIYAEFEPATAIDRAQFDTPDDVPLLLALSRLHPVKGLDILLEAMNKIPDAYLWIAGSGELEHELKAQMKALNLQERVRFLGWRDDREALLETADIVVFPSRHESFGAVVIESWATKKPIIAAKAQGPKAYVQHEQNGLLVEIDDVDGLAQATNRLIQDTDLRSNLVINGRNAYDQGFSKEVFKKNITDLYTQVKPK